MEFFHLLIIHYWMNDQLNETKIWFPSYESCWNELLDNNSLYDRINGEAGWCVASDVPSKIIRPKIRPEKP